MNQLDMLTLDIMSLVFDQLFDDPKIPVGVKGLIVGPLMMSLAVAVLRLYARETMEQRTSGTA